MAKKVTANGKTFTFDDNVSNEQISSALDEYFSSTLKKKEPTTSGLQSGSPISTKPFDVFQTESNKKSTINVATGEVKPYVEPKKPKKSIEETEAPTFGQSVKDFFEKPIEGTANIIGSGLKSVADFAFGKPQKSIQQRASEIDVTKTTTTKPVTVDYLQTVSENIGAKQFADNIEKSNQPNAKEIAEGIRQRNDAWFKLAPQQRIEERQFRKEQSLEKTKSEITSYEQEIKDINAKLDELDSKSYALGGIITKSLDYLPETTRLRNRRSELDVKLGYQLMKPEIFSSTIFKDDDEILKSLGTEINDALEIRKAQDPVGYKTMFKLFSSPINKLNSEEKRLLIKDAIELKQLELERDYENLNVDIIHDNGIYIGNNQFVSNIDMNLLEKILGEL